VKRQVDGAETVGEPFGPRAFVGHGTSVPAGGSIVNPDGSAGGRASRGWLRQARHIIRVIR
jgi:hypothetical protein